MSPADEKSAYTEAGVDIQAGDDAVSLISKYARATMRPEVLEGIGGFAGSFSASFEGLEDPVLVSGTDGVGTKLKVAFATGRHDTIGIDLVAMCVNDVVTCG
ncbi:MAG TPA: AIR synthase related protein, partial [Actinomycetota bacterium]|nr:AIR synthase related protein [Actinomycetota bacterium]